MIYLILYIIMHLILKCPFVKKGYMYISENCQAVISRHDLFDLIQHFALDSRIFICQKKYTYLEICAHDKMIYLVLYIIKHLILKCPFVEKRYMYIRYLEI